MHIREIEENVEKLVKDFTEDRFIFDFLLSFGCPKMSITRLQKGDYNLSNREDEIIWKNKILFKKANDIDPHILIDELKNEKIAHRHKVRFIIVTDFNILLSLDLRNDETLDIPIRNLDRYYSFFLPLAGLEKEQVANEHPADRKAAEKLGKLYDLLYEDKNQSDDLNIFLSRLLFCFFAEDTNIFQDNQFTSSISSHTANDGSDLKDYIERIFKILNLKEDAKERKKYPKYLQDFPYVNGGLFEKKSATPIFDPKSRKIIIDCGELNWKDINPDIFGSMIQAVVHRSERGNLGIHYTSVTNIMKVIKPLFLDDLYSDYEKAGDNKKKLNNLLARLRNLKIFDPACGSGNFLIIAYKEISRLEMEIFEKLKQADFRNVSQIELEQFYGIEIDDFAHETAKLSLYLAEHQMNLEFEEKFDQARATLPLQDGGNIIRENAARLDWEKVCPKDENSEIYILGNPPYLGYQNQKKEQKKDMEIVFSGFSKFKSLDYVSIWFMKAANYIAESIYKFSFFSTNSICQGEQVSLLWPHLFNKGIEIYFAYNSFKWTNNARGNAGVACIIIGMRKISSKSKYLFNELGKREVKNINAYLSSGKNIIIPGISKSISELTKISLGNMAKDGGHLILSKEEKNNLLQADARSEKFLYRFLGSREFINGVERWCLWIIDKDIKLANNIQEIKIRQNSVRKFRLASPAPSTKKYADRSHRFIQISFQKKPSIIIPRVSSERRHYIPIGFLDKNIVISDSAHAIYDPPDYLFAIISSRMHMVWVRAVGGKLEDRIRYSSDLCYNTFPFPEISDKQKKELELNVRKVLKERERYSEKTLAQLYDPDKMPIELKKAHNEMDLAIEQCYRSSPFKSDGDRLSYLFELYEKMTASEKIKG